MSITSQRVFTIHPKQDPTVPLPERLRQLLVDQRRSWRDLADGYDALSAVKTRTVDCSSYSVKLQFNPRRITSTNARVDEKSIKMRRCFLCIENLPDDQRGVLYHDYFLVLCNPAPIFDGHFTISHVRHTEQSLGSYVADFLDLARELSPSYTVFYNGPKCGASAPDHMHFQACPAGVLPVETLSTDESRRVSIRKEDNLSFLTLRDLGRQVILIESPEKAKCELAVRRLLEAMQKVLRLTEEPMVNVLGTFADGLWRIIVLPRSKHRPDVYFRQGDDKVMISPAAVDLGGLIITPMEKDFLSVDAPMVEGIFAEVSLEASVVSQILDAC